MEVLAFGHSLLYVVAGVLGLILVLLAIGLIGKDRRFIVASRVAICIVSLLILASAGTLVWAFVTGQYNNEYVWGYSDRDLPIAFKFAGLWGGLDGSLLFWTLLLSFFSSLAAIQHRWSARHPSGRRMEPWVYLVLTCVLGFFVALVIKENPFSVLEYSKRLEIASRFHIEIDSAGNLLEGKGLNPQLVNYWFVIHPPCLYLGLVAFTIPFAFGIAALISGELGPYWIRITRRWAMVSWLFLTCGIILGGLWAYRQLGWGGYWAWDPVENASFLPWLTGTAFLHSIMIQERRDMLKWWNAFLLIFTFYLTIEATYMTRSGEVDSVHSFGTGAGGPWYLDLAVWFRCFKWTILGSGAFLLFRRFWDLRGQHRLESLLSREAAFFFNNLVLVAIALSVWFLSWLPSHSAAYLGAKYTFEPRDFNWLMTPFLLALVFLTAIGPSLGWVKSTGKLLRRNLTTPLLLSAVGLASVYVLWWSRGLIGGWHEVVVPKPIWEWFHEAENTDLFFAVGLYPTGAFLFLAFLIVTTIASEFFRGIRSRRQFRGEDLVTASIGLVTRDNRRYGGYLVHIGLATLTIGITISAMFRTEKEVVAKVGEPIELGPYRITATETNRPFSELADAVGKIEQRTHRVQDFEGRLPYLLDQVSFEVSRVGESAGTKTARAQGESTAGKSAAGKSAAGESSRGVLIARLEPERRWYPKQSQWINEVSIERRLLEDVYVYYRGRDAQDNVQLVLYLNPFMMLLYIGWIIMIAGGLFAILPFSGSRVGLSE